MKKFLFCSFIILFFSNYLFALSKEDETLIRNIVREELKNNDYIEKEIDSQMKRKFIPQITNTITNKNSNNNVSNINTKLYIDYNQVNFFKILIGGNKNSLKYFEDGTDLKPVIGVMWKHRLFSSDWFFDLNLLYDSHTFKSDEYFETNRSHYLDSEFFYKMKFKPRFETFSPIELNIGRFITDNFLVSIGINYYMVTLDAMNSIEYTEAEPNGGKEIDHTDMFNENVVGFNFTLEYNFNRRFGLRGQYKYVKYPDFRIFKSLDFRNNIYSLQAFFTL